jgi:hypothetical protein
MDSCKLNKPVVALDIEIRKCMQELIVLQSLNSNALFAARKITPGEYIFGIIHSIAERRIPYEDTDLNNTISDILIELWAMHRAVLTINERFLTIGGYHPRADFDFIIKIKRQLAIIQRHVNSAEFDTLIAQVNPLLDFLSARIRGREQTLQDRLEEEHAERLRGEGADEDDTDGSEY